MPVQCRSVSPMGFFQVKEYERGVQLRFGESLGIVEPGLHTGLPVVDEIRIIDTRPVVFTTHLDALSTDDYPVKASLDVTYSVADAEKLVVHAPDDVEHHMGLHVKSEASRQLYGSWAMKDFVGRRDELARRLERFLDEQVSPWGLQVEAVRVTDVEMPKEIPDLQRELYQTTMDDIIAPLRAEVEAKVAKIRASAEADTYRTKAAARVEAAEQYYEMLGGVASRLVDSFGPKEGRDVFYILLANEVLGSGHPVAGKIRTKMEAEGIAEGAAAAAEEVRTDPKFAYVMTSLQRVRPGLLGVVSFDGLAALDQKLSRSLFPG